MTTDNKQDSPRSVRLWADNDAWLEDTATCMYGGNLNAALNIALMRARGKGDYEVEQACKKHMKPRRRK